MTRILLLCPEPLGHRNPAGVGIRFLEFGRMLRRAGHEVTVLTPDSADIEGCTSGDLTPQSIRESSSKAGVAVVQGHVANDFFAHAEPVPTVIDLYDPFIVENLHYTDLGAQTFAHDHDTLMRSLDRGDFFLCASEVQRTFYLGLLLAAGRINPESFASDPNLDEIISVVPFGVPEPMPSVVPRPASHDLLFGGIYDWYEPQIAIDAVALARTTIGSLTLAFTTHPNADLTPQGVFGETKRYVERRGFGEFVRFQPWTAYEDRADHYSRFGAAILTFPHSLETDLAMRTRIFDFFWGGLPVITSSARGTDPLIRHYDAGIVIESNEPAEFARAILELFADRDRYDRYVEGARRFTADHQWDRLGEPLLSFARSPHFEPTRQRYRRRDNGTITTPRPSILTRLRRRFGGLF